MEREKAELFHRGDWTITGKFVLDRDSDLRSGDTASSYSGKSQASAAIRGEYGVRPGAFTMGYVASGNAVGADQVDFQFSTQSGLYDFHVLLDIGGYGSIDDRKALEEIRKLQGEKKSRT